MSDDLQLFNYLLRNSLAALTAKSFQHLKGGEALDLTWLVRSMAWHLEEVEAGREKRLIINVPPRHLKSISASVAFPAYVLGRNPATTIILVCYSNELSEKMMRDLREIMESAWYRRTFTRTRLKVNRADEIITTENGGVNVTSVKGTLTGRGADIIILDDPIKPGSALSDAERRSTNDWLGNTLFSRLNDKRTGRIVVAMQRLHEEDVTGYLTEAPDHGWTVLKVPAIAEEETVYRVGNRHGEEWYRRPVGSVIDENREDRPTLDRLRRELGSLHFSAQYQQEPLPREGNLIKREWLRPFDLEAVERSSFQAIVASWDTASEAGPGNDYSVGTIWGIRNDGFYLLWLYRRRLSYPQLKRHIEETCAEHDVDGLILERADSGRNLRHDVKRPDGAKVFSIVPKDSKEDRVAAASGLIESGKVFIPESAPWLNTFLTELLGFPGTRFDDQVDSVSQFLNAMRSSRRLPIILGAAANRRHQKQTNDNTGRRRLRPSRPRRRLRAG